MGKLFDKHVRLFKGLVYERDAYDKRPGCDPEIIAQGLTIEIGCSEWLRGFRMRVRR